MAAAIAYLNAHHPVVRVGLEDAMGFGHQSASVHVACRLRALGYVGVFEIVASEHSVPKLAALLQSLGRRGPAPRIIDFAEAAQREAAVAVVGGWGDTLAPLHARTCLMLQPLAWSGVRAVVDPLGVHPLGVGAAAAFRYDAVPSAGIAEHIEQLADPTIAASLTQIVRTVQSGRSDLMLIYGMHHLLRPKDTIRRLAETLAEHSARPAVCLVVDAFTQPGAVALRDSAAVARALAGPAPVTTVLCKALPEPLFRALCHLSTLPPVLEGANTTNLMRLAGRPYLSVLTRSTPYPRLWRHRTARRQCEALVGMLNGKQVFDPSALREFLRAARSPDSDVCRYFAALQAQVRAPAADQVAHGLVALHRSLLRQGAPSRAAF